MSEVIEAEKQEFIDRLSGKERYYRITINGYGGESAYISISKEAFEFWDKVKKENGDSDLVEYMINSESEDTEYEYIDDVPESAQFLMSVDSDGEKFNSSWYEADNEIEHTYGVSYDSAWISVDEMSKEEYNADYIDDVIDREELTHLADRVYEESGDEHLEIVEYSCCDEPDEEVKYIAQLYSTEKGCFFDGMLKIYGDFDPKKLKVDVVEYLNGEDTVTMVYYDGEEVENYGGDTNGKGYSADVWEV